MPSIRTISVSGSIPSITQLALGDLAINTYDGKAYIKKQQGTTQTVLEVGSGAGGGGGVTQIIAGTNITISPVGGTGAVTINASSTVVSASYALSSSYSNTAVSASYALSASYAATSSYSTTASDILVYVKNQSGNTIDKGMVVRITGSNNSSDIPRVVTASYINDTNSANTLGIAYENITNGSEGYVITEGRLLGIDTTNYISGQLLYLGATGSITGSAPVAPLHAVRLGEVIRHQTNNGSIYVRIDNGYELGELHDVLDTTTTGSYGDLLVKSGSVWTNSRSLTGSYSITGSLTISGSSTFTNIGPAIMSGSYKFYSEQDSAFIATVSGSRSGGDTAFVFRKTGETTGGRHLLGLEYNTGTDNSRIFSIASSIGGTPWYNAKGNGSININMPSATTNYGGVAIGGWNSSYPSLLVRGTGTTSATTALLVQNSNASSSLVVLDNGYVGINTGSAAYNLDVNGTIGAKTSLTNTQGGDFYFYGNSFIASGNNGGGGVTGLYAQNRGGNGDVAIGNLRSNGLNLFLIKSFTNSNYTSFQQNNGTAIFEVFRVNQNLSLSTLSAVTASSSLAQGVLFQNTLVASASNDTLVGLDINPSFNTGSFTGVSTYGLRVKSTSNTTTPQFIVAQNSSNNYSVYMGMNDSRDGHIQASGRPLILNYDAGNVIVGRSGITYNFIVWNNMLINTTTDAGYKLDVNGTSRFSGNLIVTGSATNSLLVKGSGTTSATTALLVQDSSANSSLEVLDNNSAKVGRVSTYTTGNSTLLVGHKTNTQYTTDLVLDPNKDDSTYYKLVLESRYYSLQPFQLYSSGVQTWLYGYGNPMIYQPCAMKIPTQISMGTTDIGKSEISGSVLFIHGEDFYAQAAYTRYTSYSTGVATLRGAVTGLWTGNKFRVWNYENTSIDLGVNNVQRLQVTPSGINVTGSIDSTGNIRLTGGTISSGEFANPSGGGSVAIGYACNAGGISSIVVGFISDVDSGKDYSQAFGYEARSYLPGQTSFAWGNHVFNNRDAGAQQSLLTVRATTPMPSGGTAELSIGGNLIEPLGSNRGWTVVMDWNGVVASITGTAAGISVGDVIGGTIRAVVKKVGGTLSIVGIISNDQVADGGLVPSSMTFNVGPSNNLVPTFTAPIFGGGGSLNMRLTGGIKLVENSF